MIGKAVIAAIATVSITATVIEIKFPPRPVILYNPSQSAPIGFYKLRKIETPSLGMKVAAFAPDWARRLADERDYLPKEYPLIKSVLAIEGDEVCHYKTWVSVPKSPVIPLRSQDTLGRDMPVKTGCYVLKLDEYFIGSPDVQDGFDSRYFGPVSIKNILGEVKYLGMSKNAKDADNVGYRGFKG